MGVRIIVDSTVDFMEEDRSRVTVVPLTVRFGETEYMDGVTITHKEFYEKLVESDVLPTTSQATPDAFDKVYRQVAEAGDSAVVLTLSANLSGTYQSAVIAAEDYENIYVVDTGSAAIGSGILTRMALMLRDQGMSAEALKEELERQKQDICIIALVDTLEYLRKGGRLSGAAAFAGSLLNIKPVLSIVDGVIRVLGKARGSKQGNNLLMRQIAEVGGVDFTRPILLGYTGLTDVYLKKYIEDSASLWASEVETLPYAMVGSVIGTHAGPGVIAVAFFKNR